jgi:hypothetical protein
MMPLFSKRCATLVALLLVLGLAVANARVMGVQSCRLASDSYYTTGLQDWSVSVGKTCERTSMFCGKTAYNVRLCCEKETRTDFKGCEPADETRAFPTCWGNKDVPACCTPSK